MSDSEYEKRRAAYIDDAVTRARSLGNRGPIRFDTNGRLPDEIRSAFDEHGFYIFEGVIDPQELAELRAEVGHALARAPVRKSADVDHAGNPPLGAGLPGPSFSFVRPLTDPLGGTSRYEGRHPVKMIEPAPAGETPEYTVELILSCLRLLESCLRLYGHPQILRVAESLLGPDFVPFNENIFIKEPGVGASVAWHQDGTTHWDAADHDHMAHGYNNQVQLFEASPANCLWVLPGSHRHGRVDIRALLADQHDDLLPGAVPILCKAGDVSVCNRQAVHGSFANVTPDRRWSITYGFLPYRRVCGVANRRLDGRPDSYDEARIRERARMIPIAVDARAQHRANEIPFSYAPLAGEEDANRWDDAAREWIRNYARLNVHI